jgi:hypothetical protein
MIDSLNMFCLKNKRRKAMKYFYFFGLIILVCFVQIINILEGATYQWEGSITIFCILLLISLILSIISSVSLSKILNKLKQKDYDFVIKSKGVFINKIRVVHYLYYAKALSFLEKENLLNFKVYIDKIVVKELLLTKLYLLFIYHALIDDKEKMSQIKEQYNACSNKKNLLDKDGKQKDNYDKVIELIEKKEDLNEEEICFLETIPFEQIKKLILKNKHT